MSYHLGSSQDEQKRLEIQAQLYNDAQYIQFEKTMNICELGCGNGANLWVAQQLTTGHYIGIDIQEQQIAKAREKAIAMSLTNASFYLADAATTNVSSQWADLTFCRLVLVHNAKPLELLTGMARITKPGGRVLAIEPNNLAHICYNKPYLNQCTKARLNYMYGSSKGTLEICPQLYHLFKQVGLSNIMIKQHPIYCDSREPELLKLYYKNWIIMLENVKEQLFANNIISTHDYEKARIEAETINEGDSIYQSLWIAEANK